MIRRHFKIKMWLWLGIIVAMTSSSFGQSETINLEEALNLARKNYAGLERDRLSIEHQNKLATTGIQKERAQIYLSGEEFGANNQSGIHSINLQQNFYLPKAAKIQQEFYKKGALLAEKNLALTDQELKRQVEQAYFQLLFAKQNQQLVDTNSKLYEDFLSVTTAQLESGETGKIPQLAARSRLGQAKLAQEHSKEQYQIAKTLFNQWLGGNTQFDIAGELPIGSNLLGDSISLSNPHLQIIQAQREVANAKIATEKAQLFPQINSGVKLQTANGTFPLFGYQVGVNVPLFKKAYQGRIEAAEIEVKVQEASLKNEQQKLGRTISELRYRLEHQLHILEFLQEDLTPIVIEQSAVNQAAYQEGEIGYLEYLDGLEQVIKVKQQYLTALYEFHVLQIEMNYWLGK